MSKPTKRRQTPLRTNKLGERLAAIDVAAQRIDEAQTPEQLANRLVALREAVAQAIDATIVRAHKTGSPWSSIAAALRVSPQAVQQRFQKLMINAG